MGQAAGAGQDDPTDGLSTRQRPRVDEPSGPSTVFRVAVVNGPDRGAAIDIDASMPGRALVGTSPSCALRLTDRLVSRRHLTLDATEAGLRLVELGSTNGTFVGPLRVSDVWLHGGELVTLGDTTLRVVPEPSGATAELPEAMRFGRLVGGSRAMRRLYPVCERIAATTVPLIIEGETGTGKELLAEAIHEAGPRAARPFIVFDCTAVSPQLVESHLFGHERGAFTGAVAARKGVFELADGGTLLLDEIGDLDLALQAKLLRALQRGEVQRLGSERFSRVDVRIISATRRDIDRQVQDGTFRDDLFRLAVARVELPPLRERRGDVALLARHFARQLDARVALPDDLLDRLEGYAWPGNVRELYNVIARWVALGELAPTVAGAPLEEEDEEPAAVATPPGGPLGGPPRDPLEEALALDLGLALTRQRVVEELERRYVARVLERCGGNVARAAAASGIARRYFQLLRARQR